MPGLLKSAFLPNVESSTQSRTGGFPSDMRSNVAPRASRTSRFLSPQYLPCGWYTIVLMNPSRLRWGCWLGCWLGCFSALAMPLLPCPGFYFKQEQRARWSPGNKKKDWGSRHLDFFFPSVHQSVKLPSFIELLPYHLWRHHGRTRVYYQLCRWRWNSWNYSCPCNRRSRDRKEVECCYIRRGQDSPDDSKLSKHSP